MWFPRESMEQDCPPYQRAFDSQEVNEKQVGQDCICRQTPHRQEGKTFSGVFGKGRSVWPSQEGRRGA